MPHIEDFDQKIFPKQKRHLTRHRVNDFIESFTGIRKYASPKLRCEAVREIICWIVDHYGDDYEGYTFAHQYISGPRLRRFTVWKFPLDPQPDRLSVRTRQKSVEEDSGWFGVEPEDESMWMRVLEAILMEIGTKFLSKEEIHLRVGGAVKEKPVESETPED